MTPTSVPSSFLANAVERRIFGPALGWWRGKVAELGRLPARADFGPEDLTPKALPYVVISEIGPNAEPVRFRLVGGVHVAFTERDFTGLTLEETYPPNSPALAYVRGLYRELSERARPLWSVNSSRHPRLGHSVTMCRMMLPLSNGGERVDMALSVQLIETSAPSSAITIAMWHQAPVVQEIERRFLDAAPEGA